MLQTWLYVRITHRSFTGSDLYLSFMRTPSIMYTNSGNIDELIVRTFLWMAVLQSWNCFIKIIVRSLAHKPASQMSLIWLHREGHSSWDII